MSSCCCRTPRYKRLVDSLFPEDPQSSDPLTQDLDKLLYLARSEPEKLDDVGICLVAKLKRSLARDRRGHVCVSLKIMEKLLSELSTERLQLLAESYLDMMHELLQSNDLFFQTMAANSFVAFAELEEDSPPYHRQYDFCIERFAAMCLVKHSVSGYIESRQSGLRALRGVVHKVGPEGGDLWESDHLNMIIPAFLINMQDHAHNVDLEGEEDNDLASLAEVGLKELIAAASLVHANAILHPVLEHFDLSNIWLEDSQFAAETFVLITSTMQPQVRYLAIQILLSHVDSKARVERQLKRSILEVLSRCVGVASDESIGPSVLDVFRTLMKHLRNSIEDPSTEGKDEGFHETIVRMVGEFAAVLPDFHNPDIMNLIFSYLPLESDGSLRTLRSDKEKDIELVSLLVKCLLEVASSSKPSMLDTSMSESLMTSLSQLFDIEEPNIQHDIILLWQRLIDHHNNKLKIPLHTTWESLGECSLVLGKTTVRFLHRSRKFLFHKLINLITGLTLRKDNIIDCYILLCLLVLEFGSPGIGESSLLATEIQDVAQTHPALSTKHRYLLHSYVSGLLHLVSMISENEGLGNHIAEVLEDRRTFMSYLLPDHTLQNLDEFLGESPRENDEEGKKEEMPPLFQLREKGFVQQNPDMFRNSSMFREYGWESGRSFRSFSMDQSDDQDSVEVITFEHLKEGSLDDNSSPNLKASEPPLVPTFEEMLGRVSHNTSIRDDVEDILKSTSPRNTTTTQTTTSYDLQTPSFH